MARAYSTDLRERVVDAYDHRTGSVADVAKQFRIGVKTIYRYLERRKTENSLLPHKSPGRPPNLNINDQSLILLLIKQTPDISLEELLVDVESKTGKSTSVPALSRLCKKLGLSRKKKCFHATERDSDEVKKSAKITRWQ